MKICKYIAFNNSKYAPFFHISLESNYRNLPPGAFASAATFHSPDCSDAMSQNQWFSTFAAQQQVVEQQYHHCIFYPPIVLCFLFPFNNKIKYLFFHGHSHSRHNITPCFMT